LGLHDKLLNTNSAVYVIVLIWWIGCLWIDEPGTAALESGSSEAPVREYLDANETAEGSDS
jgi:hypothetical protein